MSRNTITPVPCPGISRTELHSGSAGVGDHGYALVNQVESGILLDNLKMCTDAIGNVNIFEEWLSQELGFQKKNCSHLLEIEKLLISLAATNGLSKGVYYHVTFKKDGENLTRYFESGSYDGLMENVMINDPLLQGIDPYSIFTKTDVDEWAIIREKTKKRKSAAQRKVKSAPNASKSRDRTSERCSDLLKQLQKSIAMFVAQINDAQLSLKSFVVCVLRDNSIQLKVNNMMYSYVYGHSNEYICTVLKDHAKNGHKSVEVDIRAKLSKQHLSISEQFQFLSHVPNLHWKLCSRSGVSFARCVSTLDRTYFPVSKRNRYIHYIVAGKPSLAMQVFTEQNGLDEPRCEPSTSSATPAKKANTDSYAPLPVQGLEEGNQTESPDVAPITVQLTMYEEYVRIMVDRGCISWRSAVNNQFEVAMNDFDPDSYLFLPSDFVHVKFNMIFSECTCSTFRRTSSADGKCLHSQFVKYHIRDRLTDLFNSDWLPQTNMDKLLHQNVKDCHCALSVLGNSNNAETVKFSVKGEAGSLGFVHLCKEGKYIACQSRSCAKLCGSRKSVQELCKLNEAQSLCPHLVAMHAHHELWENIVDREQGERQQRQSHFNVETGLWDFGGLSTHKPRDIDSAESDIIREKRCIISQKILRGEQEGIKFRPTQIPNTCDCGAGYFDEEHPEGVKLELQFRKPLTLYTALWSAKCLVYRLKCCSDQCEVIYTGEEDFIYFWSSEIGIGEEVLQNFLRKMLRGVTFAAFCEDMNVGYSHGFPLMEFMPSNSFIDCFFGWLASMKIDFRQEIDPWCGYTPDYLACDGTHVGVSMEAISVIPIESPELPEIKANAHCHFDRVFLADPVSQSKLKETRDARAYLRYLANKYLKEEAIVLSKEDAEKGENALLHTCPEYAMEIMVLFAQNAHSLGTPLLIALGKVMKLLVQDKALEAFIPYQEIPAWLEVFEDFIMIDSLQGKSCFEIFELVNVASSSAHKTQVQTFLKGLATSILKIHANDPRIEVPGSIPGSYNPSKGIAYYFTKSGEQVRKLPMYEAEAQTKQTRNITNKIFDAEPKTMPCNKTFSHIFLWFCPIHGHCYGFHLLPEAKGRKDAFCSLLKYLPKPPSHLFYDFACNLSEYTLNREPAYFRFVRFWHDIFNGVAHNCGDAFKSERVKGLTPNKEICKQFNAHLKPLKCIASNLSQDKFTFLMQYIIYRWNKKQTARESLKDRVSAENIT